MALHMIEVVPERIIRKMVRANTWSYINKRECGFIVYGSRKKPRSMWTSVISRGEAKRVFLAPLFILKLFTSFHTHPRAKPLPSTGDIAIDLRYHKKDRYGTLEGFVIGHPESEDSGIIAAYMVTDWGLMEEVYREVEDVAEEYSRYLGGEGEKPEGIREAQKYVWERLPEFAIRQDVEYQPHEVRITERVPIVFTEEDVNIFLREIELHPGFEIL